MSVVKSQAGAWKFKWKTTPQGREGKVRVEIQNHGEMDVSWRIDSQGIWIQTESGISGFDIKSQVDDSFQKTYEINQRNSFAEWKNISASIGEESVQKAARPNQVKVARVKAQMPGKIIQIKVKPDQSVEKDQSLMVMEAMKMENEIRAPFSGKVTQIHVNEGQAVESGAELLRIDPTE